MRGVRTTQGRNRRSILQDKAAVVTLLLEARRRLANIPGGINWHIEPGDIGWRTIKGTHVYLGKGGLIREGPPRLRGKTLDEVSPRGRHNAILTASDKDLQDLYSDAARRYADAVAQTYEDVEKGRIRKDKIPSASRKRLTKASIDLDNIRNEWDERIDFADLIGNQNASRSLKRAKRKVEDQLSSLLGDREAIEDVSDLFDLLDDDYPQTISYEEQKRAALDYMGIGGSYRINTALRRGEVLPHEEKSIFKTIEGLDALLAEEPTSYDQVVTRRVEGDTSWMEKLKPGTVYTDPAYISTYPDDRALYSDAEAVMVIDVPRGTHAGEISTMLPDNMGMGLLDEFLIGRNMRLKVISNDVDEYGQRLLHVKVVGRDDAPPKLSVIKVGDESAKDLVKRVKKEYGGLDYGHGLIGAWIAAQPDKKAAARALRDAGLSRSDVISDRVYFALDSEEDWLAVHEGFDPGDSQMIQILKDKIAREKREQKKRKQRRV